MLNRPTLDSLERKINGRPYFSRKSFRSPSHVPLPASQAIVHVLHVGLHDLWQIETVKKAICCDVLIPEMRSRDQIRHMRSERERERKGEEGIKRRHFAGITFNKQAGLLIGQEYNTRRRWVGGTCYVGT